ncbi:MAG TPA: SRPBCC family protein [Gemmatimonadaceae bacterium]
MPRYTSSIDINASPRLVWTILADVEQWPSWTPTMTAVTKLTPGRLGKGTAAHIVQPKLPRAVWRVTEIHEGRDFTWVSKMPGLRVTATHAIQSTATGARVTLSIRMTGVFSPVAALFISRLNTRYLMTEARSLKARCEEPAEAPVAK